ncbi:uncharacterized protein RAG0_07182 [Rhynchosporium agropyri]|uniref:DUF1917-domain-containing protein n=1 Tax=Rhynchosporium agropyri TaxID=914238 RepID=A0A1E1KKC0_9HELO|nr:uncharacterized protein RAG0_07182 [Rhynchosporium agropyri]
MAIGRGGRFTVAEDTGYLSDESDFYGDEATRSDLEARNSAFDAQKWLENRSTPLIELARQNLTAPRNEKTAVTLYNPYNGMLRAKQLHESVEEFLERLAPATTPVTDGPWIFLANPYRKVSKYKYSEAKLADEGPLDDGASLAEFVVRGIELLEQLTVVRHDLEKKTVGRTKAAMTKALNKHKEDIVKQLLETAVELRVTTGKWMIFPSPSEVNEVWSVVAHATANNQLGISSKVAADDGDDRSARLICIYTNNFKDMADVRRVLLKLKDLGLVQKGKGIYYKCDAYTYLGLKSNNEYNIKASLYSSKDLFEAKDSKLENFLCPKKKQESGDWKRVDME